MPDAFPDLDLRLVRYFTVVAEHEHFGRAAAALHLAQPSLSRQVRRLEQQLGTRLLDRTPQGSRPTQAGQVFLEHARELLRSAAEASTRTRAAGEPRRLVLGYPSKIIVTPVVHRLRQRHPDAEVTALHLRWSETRAALLDGRVDAVVARLPFPTDGLDTTALYDEPRVLLVPLGHRLAGRESVTLDDIADEPLPRLPDAAFNAWWRIDPRPDGRPAPDGPEVAEVEDKFEVIADGRAVAIVPVGILSGSSYRPDLTTVPLADVGPSRVVLATRAGERGRLVADLRAIAQRLLTCPAV